MLRKPLEPTKPPSPPARLAGVSDSKWGSGLPVADTARNRRDNASRDQEDPVRAKHPFADSRVVKTCHSPTMPAFLRLALDENLRALNGALLVARSINGVDDGNRTHDRRYHKPELYQLSYIHHNSYSLLDHPKVSGAPGRTRTCDPRLRRPLLYPAELRAHYIYLSRPRTPRSVHASFRR